MAQAWDVGRRLEQSTAPYKCTVHETMSRLDAGIHIYTMLAWSCSYMYMYSDEARPS